MCYLMCLLVSISLFVASSVYCSYNIFRVLSDLSSPGSIIWDSFDEIFNYYEKSCSIHLRFQSSFSSHRR